VKRSRTTTFSKSESARKRRETTCRSPGKEENRKCRRVAHPGRGLKGRNCTGERGKRVELSRVGRKTEKTRRHKKKFGRRQIGEGPCISNSKVKKGGSANNRARGDLKTGKEPTMRSRNERKGRKGRSFPRVPDPIKGAPMAEKDHEKEKL